MRGRNAICPGVPKLGRFPQKRRAARQDLSWRLPSGQALAEFALESGFLAAELLQSGASPRRRSGRKRGAGQGERKTA